MKTNTFGIESNISAKFLYQNSLFWYRHCEFLCRNCHALLYIYNRYSITLNHTVRNVTNVYMYRRYVLGLYCGLLILYKVASTNMAMAIQQYSFFYS